jgi:predicted DNA-binding protein YlxM (UPF0122 family)
MPAGLSQRHKTILVLRYEDRLSYKEIAEQMGISQEDLFLPPDHQQKRQEDAKSHLLQLKRLLEGLE